MKQIEYIRKIARNVKPKHLMGAALMLGMSTSGIAKEKPNMLFIMVDDLGYGQFALHNDNLTVDEFDPYFTQLVKQRETYTPEEALKFSKRAMPTMSRLGKRGVVFTKAYAASSLCAPSRLAVATGRTLPQQGIYINSDVESKGIQPNTHLAHILQDGGYATAHIGKWHVGKRDSSIIQTIVKKHGIKGNHTFWSLKKQHPKAYDEAWEAGYYGSVIKGQNPLQNGFDYYYGYNNWASQFYNSPLVWENYRHAGRQPGYNTEVFTDKALDFMKSQVQNKKPFYLQLHYHAVHDYLEPNAPDKYMKMFNSKSYNLRNFYAHVYAVDYNIQRIVDFLKENNALDNTIIAFTSDNGGMVDGPSVLPGNAPFSGHKGNVRQGGLRIPLVFSWPAGIKKAKRLDSIVSSIDIIPTMIDAAGLKAPKGIDAKSLLPMLTTNSNSPVRDQFISAGINARAWGFLFNKSLVPKWKERNSAPGGWAIADGDYVLRYRGTIVPKIYADFKDGAPAELGLYNITKDPAETTDLKDKMPELTKKLKQLYFNQTHTYKKPKNWKKQKWEEIAGHAAK